MKYYAICNDAGTVLAVYGSALMGIALHNWRELQRLGSVHFVVCRVLGYDERPHVNQTIDIRKHVCEGVMGCKACKVHA